MLVRSFNKIRRTLQKLLVHTNRLFQKLVRLPVLDKKDINTYTVTVY
jgi:hypothetical protein